MVGRWTMGDDREVVGGGRGAQAAAGGLKAECGSSRFGGDGGPGPLVEEIREESNSEAGAAVTAGKLVVAGGRWQERRGSLWGRREKCSVGAARY